MVTGHKKASLEFSTERVASLTQRIETFSLFGHSVDASQPMETTLAKILATKRERASVKKRFPGAEDKEIQENFLLPIERKESLDMLRTYLSR